MAVQSINQSNSMAVLSSFTREAETCCAGICPQTCCAGIFPVPAKLLVNDATAAMPEGEGEDDCFSPQRRSHNDSAPTTPRIISNLHPTQMLEGTSGVYLLTNDKGVGVAVFKPLDEENLPAEASTWAMSKGKGYFRERAAFVVSDEILEGYSGVPTTVIATVKHEGWEGGEKRGSLQRFVPASSDMCDRGPANIPAEEVQKIGILDILLFNMDRHEGNLLLSSGQQRSLVPIDHGLCLPEIISQNTGPNHELLHSIYFVWQTWPQAQAPFSDAVNRLLDRQLADDLFKSVVGKLKKEMGRNSLTCGALTTLKIGAMVLKKSLHAGLNLSEMADLVRTGLPGLMQKSWEEATRIVKVANEGKKDAGDEKHHTDGEKGEVSVGEVAIVPYHEQRQKSVETLNLSVEDDDHVYLVWEALLLRDLEIRLGLFLCAHNASAAKATSAAAFAPSAAQEQEEFLFDEVEKESLYSRFEQDALRGGFVGVKEEQGADKCPSTAYATPSARVVIEYLDDDYPAVSADEDEGTNGRSARTASLLPSPEKGADQRKSRSSSPTYLKRPNTLSRRRRECLTRSGIGKATAKITPRRRAAMLARAAGSGLEERVARLRGGWRQRARGEGLMTLKHLMELLDVKDKEGGGSWDDSNAASASLSTSAEDTTCLRAPPPLLRSYVRDAFASSRGGRRGGRRGAGVPCRGRQQAYM